ncbi:MFS transporter [Aestuariibacter sp. A3R04]|uniref:MFS transporter n=1 Tax=Aestuariibacter sp. A3R04 TaxID=2841571 RepID=UPI001C091D00|nr:MFS transporter [Aestuariibacter sp. A3R04]MBU3020601.1 MFS transporter [Aestuariibacter sp. A3R04]
MNATEIRAALALALVYVLRMMGLFMVMPVLAVAAMDYPDYSPMLVGLAVGGYGLTQAALQIPMGMMSDRWGRKPVILLGLAVFAAGSLIAASAESMALLIAGRVLQGAGAIAGAIMALATDVSRETQRAKVMAVIGIAIGFSFYLAVLIGPLIAQHWGLSGVFGITGILAVCCMPLVKWGVPNAPSSASGDTLPHLSEVKSLFLSPRLWRLNLSVMVLHMLITLLFVQLPLTLLNFNVTLESHWMIYLPVLGVSIIGLVVLMGISRGRTPKSVMLTAAGLMMAAFFMLHMQDHHWWIVMAAVVMFFTGFNYLEASLPALVSTLAPVGKKGTAMGIYASFQFFGAFLGGLMSGLVTDIWSPKLAYLAGAIGAAIWIMVLSGMREVSKLKRLVLQADVSVSRQVALNNALMALPGVDDAVTSAKERAVYLKIEKNFDIDEARKVIAQFI